MSRLVLCLPAVLLLAGRVVGAEPTSEPETQSSVEKRSASARNDTLDWTPTEDELTQVVFETPDGPRAVPIHEMSRLGLERKFYQAAHRPIFLVVEQPSAPSGLPRCLVTSPQYSTPHYDAYGRANCKIDIVLSSPKLRAAAAEHLRKTHFEYFKTTWNLSDPSEIHVRRWPIKHLVVRVFDDRDNRLLATAVSDQLSREQDVVRLNFTFARADFDHFVDACAAKACRFVPTYTFVGRKEIFGKQVMNGELEARIKQKLNLLAPEDGGAQELLLADALDTLNEGTMNIERQIYANGPEVVAMLQSPETLFDLIFQQEQKLASEVMQNQALMERAWERFKPDIEQFQKSTGKNVLDFKAGAEEEQKRSTDGKIKNKTTTETFSAGLGGGGQAEGFGFGGSLGYSNNRQRSETEYRENSELARALDTFQRSTGVTLVEASGGTHFVPKSMSVCRVKQSVSEISLTQVSGVYLSIATEDEYLVDSPFFSHWTQEILNGEITGEQF